ncbi:hypothetical protein GR157_32285 [Burkholderia sp. 4701]|nr:hypothetical protein [Burkholderia sp. 4701]MXN86598.1 hypothetical protein [Burkholderia sp. 4812]
MFNWGSVGNRMARDGSTPQEETKARASQRVKASKSSDRGGVDATKFETIRAIATNIVKFK